MFEGEVGDEDGGNAVLLAGGVEFFEAVLLDEIVVQEEADGDCGVEGADVGEEVEAVGGGDAGLEGAFVGGLDDGAVGWGIAEREAEFQGVGAVVDEGLEDLLGSGEVGVAEHGEGGEEWAAEFLTEGLVNVHGGVLLVGWWLGWLVGVAVGSDVVDVFVAAAREGDEDDVVGGEGGGGFFGTGEGVGGLEGRENAFL